VSLFPYGVLFLSLVLGAFVLLVIVNLPPLAQKGDAYQDHLEHNRRCRQDLASHLRPLRNPNVRPPPAAVLTLSCRRRGRLRYILTT
jgi:hypothetical protein